MLNHYQLKSISHLTKSLTLKINKTYVKQAQIDQITKNYGTTNFEKIKMYAAIFKHIGIEGFKSLRQDIKLWNQIKDLDTQTQQQTRQIMRINHDLFKMGPLLIIQILPFSGPLFMLYMYTYPGSIPSWFMIDYYHDRHEQLKLQNQTKTLKHFQAQGFNSLDIHLDTMSLTDLRRICLLLFGIYRDGTVGYRKLFNKKIEYFLFPGYSRFLIRRYMQKRFNRDLLLKQVTSDMTGLQEMVRWKFDQIMKGQYRFEYKPMYEKTLQKMQANEGEQSVMFRQIQKDQQIKCDANHQSVNKNNQDKFTSKPNSTNNNQKNNTKTNIKKK